MGDNYNYAGIDIYVDHACWGQDAPDRLGLDATANGASCPT